jgi:DNA-binding MarR family transcriptional regulator
MKSPPVLPKGSECLAARTLVAVARQRKGLNAPRCQLVFEHLDTAHALQHGLQRVLADYQLSGLQFGILVALFALNPEPVAPADLTDYTAASRAAIAKALVRLESLELIVRTRKETDRRGYFLRLTDAGYALIDEALVSYLRAVGDAARHVEPSAVPDILSAYSQLQHGAAELSA